MIKKTKKIGKYLLEDQSCDREAVTEALKQQSSIESLGEYKSMGEIMVESGTVALEDLESLLAAPSLVLLGEGPGHVSQFLQTVSEGRALGNLAHDAHIAALVREHGVR